MARKGEKLQAYARHLFERCPGLSTLKQIDSSLRYAKSTVSGKKINHELPCTGGGGKLCHILDDLTVWNEFLWLLDAQLQELAPGVLGVVCLHGYYWAPVHGNPPKRHACMLLHWLLMEHRCVEVLELRETFLDNYPVLFCDALRMSAGLRKLKLCKYQLDSNVMFDVLDAIGSMKHLETLEITRFWISRDVMTRLTAVLGQMPSLKSLALHRTEMKAPTYELLLQGLKSCKNITVLLLDSCSHIPGGSNVLTEYLAQYLAQTDTLKELTINNAYGSKLEPILNVLGENQSLEKLCIDDFSLTLPETRTLVKSMSKNNTLKHLVMTGGSLSHPELIADLIEANKDLRKLTLPDCSVQCATAFAEAIRRNGTMEELSLSASGMTIDEAREFLNAVAASNSLQHVNVGLINAELVPDFCKALQETGTEQQVDFVTDLMKAKQCISTLNKCKNLSKISFLLDEDDDATVLCTIFNLLHSHQLAALNVYLDNAVDDASASALASFLSSTRTLRDLGLYFETTESSFPVILEGLRRNRSVSKLYLKPWAFDEEEEELFTALFKASKTLNHLTLDSSTGETEHDEELNSTSLDILVGLAKCVPLSYTLLNVKILEHRDFEEDMFVVRDTMRRNLSFLQRAAQFVAGVWDKRSADGFEQVHQSEALVRKVQELAQVTEAEAKERIRDSLRHLDVNFLAVVGVVKTEVVCVSDSPGRLTLDQIGVDIWLLIRSYLKVSDVLDQPAAACLMTPAKRRYVRKRKLQDPAT